MVSNMLDCTILLILYNMDPYIFQPFLCSKFFSICQNVSWHVIARFKINNPRLAPPRINEIWILEMFAIKTKHGVLHHLSILYIN
jgi:hypothetical protein